MQVHHCAPAKAPTEHRRGKRDDQGWVGYPNATRWGIQFAAVTNAAGQADSCAASRAASPMSQNRDMGTQQQKTGRERTAEKPGNRYAVPELPELPPRIAVPELPCLRSERWDTRRT
jgi:hypothetical protein